MISEVKLDINKAGQFINRPVTLRSGDTDNTIKATIYQNGTPYSNFKTATFSGNRSDGTAIANDPATISGNVITYNVAPAVTSKNTKIRNAYFLLNGNISTESFEVVVIPGTIIDGDLKSYVPGVSDDLISQFENVTKQSDAYLQELKSNVKTGTNSINGLNSKLAGITSSVNALQGKVNIGGVNLLANGDFSNSLMNWNIYNAENGTVAVENDEAGNKMLHIHSSNGPTGIFTSSPSYYGSNSLKSGESWIASGLVKGDATIIRFGIETGKYPENPYKNPTDSWSKIVSKNIRAASNRFCIYISSGDLYVKFVKVERGNIETDWTPALKDEVNTSDTADWQKSKITKDDGSSSISLSDNSTTVDVTFKSLISGLKTFYIQGDKAGNTLGDSIRGQIYKSDVNNGYAFGVTNGGKMYFKYITSGVVGSWQQVATVASAAPVAAMAYTAMVQDDTNKTLQAQNSQIAYSLMTQGGATDAK
ncbi:hypothetical protein M5C72_08425 [Companilactobacillus allii]|uniref:BppU N-terminal domain-containing protein n=1 Tax=Companilactobacillus allii TaxID=1847728 RepID=A0A1P8Q5H4_9LACO|nr:hypothetical protein [Companilactobacillus allii]APX73106.1 hypothetical protein BTM29_11330 [Companilactobacillus allii]USQ67907.1 hypothetical protein M5C72_08425 [Companilactobacillus allii]